MERTRCPNLSTTFRNSAENIVIVLCLNFIVFTEPISLSNTLVLPLSKSSFSSYSSIPFASPQVHSSPQNNVPLSFQPLSRSEDCESKLKFRPSLKNDDGSIPLLPDLTLDEKKIRERNPRSISVDELKLIRMESGLGVNGNKQWRTAIESTNRDRAVSHDATQQCLNQEILKQKKKNTKQRKMKKMNYLERQRAQMESFTNEGITPHGLMHLHH